MRVDDAQARELLARRLRHAVPDSQWDYLVSKRFVSDYLNLQEPFGFDDLLKEAQDLAAAVPAPVAQRGRRVNGPSLSEVRGPVQLSQETTTYQRALSEAVASVADLEVDVLAFRDRFLAGEIMPWDQVDAWVKAREAEQGEPTIWITWRCQVVNAPPAWIRSSLSFSVGFFQWRVSRRLIQNWGGGPLR